MLHAQLFSGKVGSRLREIVRTSSGGAEAGIDVPLVKAVTRYAREIAKKYTEEAQPTNETLVGDVLSALQVRGLLHEPDAELERVAALVSRTDTDDQFLQFEDFDELEHRENVVVVGVLRNLSTTDRSVTVRVIAVY